EQASHAIDVITTNSTFQDYITNKINIDEAINSIKSILDPNIRELAQKGLQAIIVRKAVQSNNAADLVQARNQVENIQDSQLKAIVENALRIREAAGAAVDDPTSELSVFVYDLRTEFSYGANDERRKFSDKSTQLYHTSQDYKKTAENLLGTSRQEITRLIKGHNNIPSDVNNPISLGTSPDRFATVDLSTVRGVKKIENFDAIQNSKENPMKLEQFAEFFVADKALQLQFEPNNGLGPQAIQQITGLMNELGPLFYASFASGDLLMVRFIADPFQGSGYLPSTREIQIILPKDRLTTIDALRSVLVHENVHALTRSTLGMDSDITPQEITDLQAGCTAIRTQSLNTAETRFQAMPEFLTDLRSQTKLEDRPVIDLFMQQIQDGSLDQFLRNRFGKESDEFRNDCLSLNLEALLKEFSNKTGINPDQLEYLKGTNAYKKADEEWSNTERIYAIYSRLNEAAYIQSNDENKKYKGHTEDNVKELVASTTNDAISFTDQFVQVLKAMTPDEKDAAIQAMQVSFDLITNRHESLKDYLTTLEANILQWVNQK
ncbi:MAG TPA: hypothetical protein VM077_05870, partial [Candidatus Limnocylindrales bacterium]|nr:hypothetical protein [Candidatus Limnocylindrales bacterium]